MDLRQLSALVAIADHGSFSAAARALFTVQSNVSGHIGKLERELGVTLIDRSAGRLTDEGERVLERARRILNELDDIASDIASLDSEVSGEARVGMIGTAAEWLAPGVMEEMARLHPMVHTVLSEGSTSALVPNVLTSLLNAAVIHLPIEEPDLTAEALFSEELLLLVPRGHRLHRATGVALGDLRDTPLLLPPKGAALRRIIDRAAATSGTMLRAAAEIDGVRLLTTLALAGHGPAIVPATAARDLGEGALVDHRLAQVGEGPLGEIGEPLEDQIGDHETEDGIAEELETLVALGIGLFSDPGAMAEGAPQQSNVVEPMPEGVLEGGEVRRPGDHRGQEVARSCT